MSDPRADSAAAGSCGPDPRSRLAPVAAAAALGLTTRLESALEQALDGGCSRTEIRETLLVVSLFAGFPRTLDALAVARDVCTRRRPEGPCAEPEPGLPDEAAARLAVFRTRGRKLFERVYGERADRVFSRLLDLDPELPAWVVEDAYGKVLARPGLAAAERERLAVVLLAALGLSNQLGGHVRGALRCGASPESVVASLDAARGEIPAAGREEALASLAHYQSVGVTTRRR